MTWKTNLFYKQKIFYLGIKIYIIVIYVVLYILVFLNLIIVFVSSYNIFFIMASKPTNIHWIRTRFQPYWKLCIASNYRQFPTNIRIVICGKLSKIKLLYNFDNFYIYILHYFSKESFKLVQSCVLHFFYFFIFSSSENKFFSFFLLG